ncbi:alanine racemase [Patiriisocius hiemis]|uniref:Alanine racemase n=1 Tax=Patiriisocius hiemis TaxID=3075604 RepID=A0ABU2YF18_9FLAO|nr:alanine racemase [Constantimarinum sp. W242]MDT0555643.1 alanine racemase [Constantimarinum sp. W242]
MPKAKETVLEINLNALEHNYRYITSRINNSTNVLGVVKAFGYGSDAVSVANSLAQLGVAYFGVAYTSEGEELRNGGIQTPILVLHPQSINFNKIVNRCLEPSIYSFNMLTKFIEFAESKNQKSYPIHLKFNTGLNRLGFTEFDIDEIIKKLAKTESVKVKSVFSHLAASEDLNEKVFTEKQLQRFNRIALELEESLQYSFTRHTLNTSGVLNYPNSQYEMVRTGIGLYGFGNNAKENKNLQPVATLKTIISQIHILNEGDTIGYNRAMTATQNMKTATLPIGHTDGINRAYGNTIGWVTINGKKAPIVGNVCMDMIMVDVSKIDCNEGDEVIIFGDKGSTAEELSAAINSIPYELLTAISQRVKRVICRK